MRFYFTSGKSTINNIIIVIYGKLIFVSKIHELIFQIKIVETYFKLSFMFKRINVWAFSYLPLILQNKTKNCIKEFDHTNMRLSCSISTSSSLPTVIWLIIFPLGIPER